MGKASSNKKVARAAGIGGGRTHRRRTPWGYYGIIVLIVILGVVLTVNSRERRLDQIKAAGSSTPPAVGTTWFQGYAVYECGKFAPAIKNAKNPEGITTGDGDGVIHIAPTTPSSAGKNATLGKFAEAAGMKLNAAELQLPGGKLWLDGDTCEGQPGHVYVKHFAYPGATTGQLYNGEKGQLPKLDPRDVPLGDQDLETIAFVPKNKSGQIPPPPDYVNQNLKKLAPSATTTTVPAATTPTTVKPSTATTRPTTATTRPTTATTAHSASTTPTSKAGG